MNFLNRWRFPPELQDNAARSTQLQRPSSAQVVRQWLAPAPRHPACWTKRWPPGGFSILDSQRCRPCHRRCHRRIALWSSQTCRARPGSPRHPPHRCSCSRPSVRTWRGSPETPRQCWYSTSRHRPLRPPAPSFRPPVADQVSILRGSAQTRRLPSPTTAAICQPARTIAPRALCRTPRRWCRSPH